MTTISPEETGVTPDVEREQFIAGLQALARLMKGVPEIPIPTFERIGWHFPGDCDAEARPVFDATVSALAEAGIAFTQEDTPRRWQVAISLDGLTVEIAHPTDQAMTDHFARTSYSDVVQVNVEQPAEVTA